MSKKMMEHSTRLATSVKPFQFQIVPAINICNKYNNEVVKCNQGKGAPSSWTKIVLREAMSYKISSILQTYTVKASLTYSQVRDKVKEAHMVANQIRNH